MEMSINTSAGENLNVIPILLDMLARSKQFVVFILLLASYDWWGVVPFYHCYKI